MVVYNWLEDTNIKKTRKYKNEAPDNLPFLQNWGSQIYEVDEVLCDFVLYLYLYVIYL